MVPPSPRVCTRACPGSGRTRIGGSDSRADCPEAPRKGRLFPVAARPRPLIDPLKLLNGVAIRTHEPGFPGDGPHDLGHIEISVRVDREPVWSAEAARRAGVGSADPRDHRSVRVEDAHAAPEVALDRSVPE